MSRRLVGPGLLLVLLVVGVLSGLLLDRSCRPAEEALTGAARAAAREDWETADALAEKARASWERFCCLHSCLGSQETVEDIDSRFDCLEFYLGESRSFGTACVSLRGRLEALRQAQGWELWHFL